ncbi:MAG: peptidase domain-containing ABC transporter [Bacteroidetes bacterium]|nr:peptidase domain-containing ABC transporter [Bacteroidota bacterium]
MKRFPFFLQLDGMDCGPSCLRMITKYYGKNYSLQTLRSISGFTKEGVSLLGISEAAEEIGFRTLAIKTTLEKLEHEAILPLIAHWRQSHFVVIYKITKNNIYVADPASNLITYTKKEFAKMWISTKSDDNEQGVVLLLEPTPKFFNADDEKTNKLNFSLLLRYLVRYKKLLFQLFLGLLIGSLLQLVFPFLTQSIVDIGINTRDIKFIYIILIAQLMLYLGQTSVDFIRNWVLLHINTRINISILTDFLIKLMKLPISFFDSKMVGDIIQRMGDQQRIQSFLTGPTLNVLFSFFSFIIFTIVIIHYNISVFLIFLAGTTIYIFWVVLFLRYRKKLDYKRFNIMAVNQTNLIQMIHGMQEIKMNNCETSKRWEWERIQAKVFKVSVKSLELTQYQQGGAIFINQVKNILITFFSATAVVEGRLTLGAMLAIQYIVGQLNGPIDQFIQFIQSTQDALISMERLNEIHTIEDEEPVGASKISVLPADRDIELQQVNFKYAGAGNELVLKDMSLVIPRGKISAIVGVSGSGKTTLLKLLMKFYQPESGTIKLGENNLQDIANKTWRASCGVVMQDNFIFSDTIAANIAVADDSPDTKKLLHAARVANIADFIESLPLGFNTKIGADGSGISQGQKQRILIARAVYKDPEFIFFDEATNSLDANNEKTIMENLESFFRGKTVIISAHRLSTVRHADQIIVLDQGHIIEKGTHDELILLRGAYYTLVKNQLELGN